MFEFADRFGGGAATIREFAAGLYREMLAAGYGAVGEFHYLHNAPGGQPPDPLSFYSSQLVSAAVDAGLPICLLPTWYTRGGFDGRSLAGGQLRFGLDLRQLEQLLLELRGQWAAHPLVSIGLAMHSLRAVPIEQVAEVVALATEILGKCPLHIHIAEQTAEVEQCVEATGKRPVELLLEHAPVDERWCLIHATHMSESEIRAVAAAGAVVGLCPTTEANLGDGIFPATEFLQAGGRIAIGSDSHIALNPPSELRTLEYSQRLRHRQRAMLCTPDQSCGNWLYQQAAAHGGTVLGRKTGSLQAGYFADLLVLNTSHPANFLEDLDWLLDKLVFFDLGGENMIESTWIAGQRVSGVAASASRTN